MWRGAPPRARGPPMDYEDNLPTRPWYNFAPPRRYIFVPPLTSVAVNNGHDVSWSIVAHVVFRSLFSIWGVQECQ